MPQYNVGYIEKSRKIKDDLSINYSGLYVAGASYEGLGVYKYGE